MEELQDFETWLGLRTVDTVWDYSDDTRVIFDYWQNFHCDAIQDGKWEGVGLNEPDCDEPNFIFEDGINPYKSEGNTYCDMYGADWTTLIMDCPDFADDDCNYFSYYFNRCDLNQYDCAEIGNGYQNDCSVNLMDAEIWDAINDDFDMWAQDWDWSAVFDYWTMWHYEQSGCVCTEPFMYFPEGNPYDCEEMDRDAYVQAEIDCDEFEAIREDCNIKIDYMRCNIEETFSCIREGGSGRDFFMVDCKEELMDIDVWNSVRPADVW